MCVCAVVCDTSCRGDNKESERQKLAGLIQSEANSQNSQRFSPKMTVLDLQVSSSIACGIATQTLFPFQTASFTQRSLVTNTSSAIALR